MQPLRHIVTTPVFITGKWQFFVHYVIKNLIDNLIPGNTKLGANELHHVVAILSTRYFRDLYF